MGIKKFVELVKGTLNIDKFKNAGKKKSIKNLLKKLRIKKSEINKSLKAKIAKKTKQDLLEEKEIITFQIKKGREILKKLNAEDNKNKNKSKKVKNGK